ncbi:ABC-F family ATP-binding cassette domain-containing protein [Leifsonia sp. Root112D2]|uniref:ABC-F family ATP-binding cassette domain-containing protein n=1 Tax=Leifsonia sp. Root112D2 TaxID=1736426 RepID=UPI0006FC420F|nr:ABC-F family ATP-binding cassette domain-containing protein [Leifsonia sp. Root112D2]KQV07439.1 ABC transporter ATP-binding protein [Leifsonia sp. Root112D2]
MAHLLGAEALHLEYPTRVVFDSVTVGLNEGDRVGVVGRNGDGKSTLLSLLSGRLEADAGRVTRRRGTTIGVLDQSDTLDPDLTVGATIVGEMDEHVWAGDARVRDVLAGLVTDIRWDSRVGELSGGQRRRVALAALLAGDHDVLFLDEPTNHLDIEGIAWLAGHLKSRWSANAGGLIVVTHDRWFLDEVCTATWEVHDQIIEPFEGGYAAYILQRVERDRMAAASESKRQNLMRKELAWLRRGAPARSTKPKFRMDAAYELIENEPPPRDTVALSQMAMQRLGKDVVELIDATVQYGEKTVLNTINWNVAPGERTGILGVNGAGKSTLLSLVAGTLKPTHGRVKRGTTVKIAVLDQQLAELAEVAHERVSTVVGRLRSSYTVGGSSAGSATALTPGQLLERLGFSTAQLSTPVKDLSGGQKRRLQLLLVLLEEPNVLILDEPTNDLDTDMLAAMEDLLDSFPGTLLVVSHDRYLIERVTDNQYAVLGGGFRHLPRGVDEYLELRKTVTDAASGSPTLAATAGAGSAPVAAGASALQGAELRSAEKEIASIGRKLGKLDNQIQAAHQRLAEHDQGDYEGLGALTEELRALEGTVADLETRWLELSEAVGG